MEGSCGPSTKKKTNLKWREVRLSATVTRQWNKVGTKRREEKGIFHSKCGHFPGLLLPRLTFKTSGCNPMNASLGASPNEQSRTFFQVSTCWTILIVDMICRSGASPSGMHQYEPFSKWHLKIMSQQMS